MVGGGRPLIPEFLGQPAPGWSKIVEFQSTFARSASAVAPQQKVHSDQLSQRDRAARWVLTDISSYRLELSQIIVQILDIVLFEPHPLRGLRDNVRCSSWAH